MGQRGRRQGRYSQATRVLHLQDELLGLRYRVSLRDLADRLGVTERQVRRDLGCLESAGRDLELTLDAERRTCVRMRARPLAPVALTHRERYTLLAVRRVFDVLEGTSFHEDVRSIFAKVAASLPAEQQDEIERFSDRFVYLPEGGIKAYRRKADVLNELLTGVLRRRRVQCRYRGVSGRAHEGLLEPYAVVLYKHGLYVVGHMFDGAGEAHPSRTTRARVYAAERFERAVFVRGAEFTVPRGFRLETFFQGAFGIHAGEATTRVVIDFAREATPYVSARKWHPTQSLRARPKGGVRLTMELAALKEVPSWVLQWGPLARVRAPAALVAEVARELRQAAGQYGGGVATIRSGRNAGRAPHTTVRARG